MGIFGDFHSMLLSSLEIPGKTLSLTIRRKAFGLKVENVVSKTALPSQKLFKPVLW